ncbi:MAG TPA: presenilin family intramembrane aspartyl protease [Candidatus Nanoarchaeia archaeon]|nr:presenilin family intramembrane aspartyl protease [Candidatus Nanoarchaeia archaeon]
MKHSLSVSLLLVGLFVLAQVVGLFVVQGYASQSLPLGLQPPALDPDTSFISLLGTVIVLSLVVWLLMRFRFGFLWKFWFFISLTLVLTVALAAFLPELWALGVAVVLALLKLYRHSVFWHNLPEMLLYGGLAAVFAPVFSLLSLVFLLILIAVYDAVAVWKTKHMVSLAKMQLKERLFAGLLIPYGKKKSALLGGGDIAFPLLANAVLLREFGGVAAVIGVVFAAGALWLLLWLSEKNKFYPAMVFLSVGSLLAIGLSWLFV